MADKVTIALVGDYVPSVTAHVAIPQALAKAPGGVSWEWVGTETIGSEADIAGFDAIWCVPASPYLNEAGAITAIRHARETGKPFLGTCGGYQHAVLEFTRNVLGFSEAGNVEVDPECAMPVIGALSCALIDETGEITFAGDARLASIHGRETVREEYRCSYGVNVRYLPLFAEGPLRFTGFDADGDPRTFELAGHPFFIGTAYQPERAALQGQSHPLVNAFTRAVVAQSSRAA